MKAALIHLQAAKKIPGKKWLQREPGPREEVVERPARGCPWLLSGIAQGLTLHTRDCGSNRLLF